MATCPDFPSARSAGGERKELLFSHYNFKLSSMNFYNWHPLRICPTFEPGKQKQPLLISLISD
jgi:hypothetical protein